MREFQMDATGAAVRPPWRKRSLEEAVSLIKNGDTVALGGFYFYRKPMAMVREIIRQGLRDLTLITPLGNIESDILIGAGCVRKSIFGFISLDVLGLAPNFRRKVERGEVEPLDYADMPLLRSFQAAQRRIVYEPTRALLGGDLIKHHPGKFVVLDGETLLAAPPLRPDVTIAHVQWADSEGNVQFLGEGYDLEMIKAANRVIITTEQIIAPRDLRAKGGIPVPVYHPDAVVEIPFGAHPCSCSPYYVHDLRHLIEYAEAARTEEAFKAYLAKYVFEPRSHEEYLERVGGVAKMLKLEKLARASAEFVRGADR